jgi:hypothetical protein
MHLLAFNNVDDVSKTGKRCFIPIWCYICDTLKVIHREIADRKIDSLPLIGNLLKVKDSKAIEDRETLTLE